MLIALPALEILPLRNIYCELPREKVNSRNIFPSLLPHYAVALSKDVISHWENGVSLSAELILLNSCSPIVAGVNLVLNSLAEEKLQASLRCLARHGRFLEIGKFDLSNNSQLGKMVYWEINLVTYKQA